MTPRRPRGTPAPRGLILLILMAVGFGLLAALLAGGASTSSTSPPGTNTAPNHGLLWFQAVGYAALALFGIYVGYQVYIRIAEGRFPIPARLAITGIIAILIGVAFVVAFDLVHTSTFWGGGHLAPANKTGNGGSSPVNGTNGSSGPIGGPIPSLPAFSWFDVGVIGLVVGTVIAIALLLYARAPAEETWEENPAAKRLRDDLLASLKRLEDDPEADPREVILALYQRLLLTLRPRFASTDQYTAREIEAVMVTQLGVRAPNARALTQLFEIARYSTHPLGRPEADQARTAFRAVLDDLSHVLGPRTGLDGAVLPSPPT